MGIEIYVYHPGFCTVKYIAFNINRHKSHFALWNAPWRENARLPRSTYSAMGSRMHPSGGFVVVMLVFVTIGDEAGEEIDGDGGQKLLRCSVDTIQMVIPSACREQKPLDLVVLA
jgi:hypothetical protein